MPYLSPTTLTQAEQKALLEATAVRPRDHTVFSLALGTGLRLGEIVGLNVSDLFHADGTARTRVRLRREIAKGGRVGDAFVPDALVAKLERFWLYKHAHRERLDPSAPLFCNQGRRRISKRRLSRPGWLPGRAPHQIRTWRLPPSGSTVGATRGRVPQSWTEIRGTGRG